MHMKCVASDLTPGLFKYLDNVTKLSDVQVKGAFSEQYLTTVSLKQRERFT